jgi:hypothetical protein
MQMRSLELHDEPNLPGVAPASILSSTFTKMLPGCRWAYRENRISKVAIREPS